MQVNLRIILPNENKRHGRIQTVWVPRLYVPCQRYQHWLYRGHRSVTSSRSWCSNEEGGTWDQCWPQPPALAHLWREQRPGTWVGVERNLERTGVYFSAGICWFVVIGQQLRFYPAIFQLPSLVLSTVSGSILYKTLFYVKRKTEMNNNSFPLNQAGDIDTCIALIH